MYSFVVTHYLVYNTKITVYTVDMLLKITEQLEYQKSAWSI